MTYIAHERKWGILFILFVLLALYKETEMVWTLFLFALSVPLLFLRYELYVGAQELRFSAKVFSFALNSRVATPADINKLHFKRVGWSTKLVYIRMRGMANWRVVRFSPKDFDEALERFAAAHRIPVDKQKDYELLQERKSL